MGNLDVVSSGELTVILCEWLKSAGLKRIWRKPIQQNLTQWKDAQCIRRKSTLIHIYKNKSNI